MIEGARSSPKDIEQSVEKFQPDLIVICNLDLFCMRPGGDEIEAFLTSGKWAVTCWFFEAPRMAGGLKLLTRWRQGPYPKNVFFLETDAAAVSFFTSRGLAADHLPLAIDPRAEFMGEPQVGPGFEHDAAFSGTPHLDGITFEVQPGRAAIEDVHKIGYMSKMFAMATSPGCLTAEQAMPLCSELGDAALKLFKQDLWTHGSYEEAFEKVSSELEALAEKFGVVAPYMKIFAPCCLHVFYSFVQLSALLDQVVERVGDGFAIYGAPNWQQIVTRYGKPTPRLSFEELRALYRRTKVFLCLTKRTFQSFVHERAFHVLGHGGLPLVDFREELPLYFEDKKEILSYSSPEEAIDLIKHFSQIKNERERSAIVQAGRSRVFKEHTYFHRTQKLLELSFKHFGGRPNEKNTHAERLAAS